MFGSNLDEEKKNLTKTQLEAEKQERIKTQTGKQEFFDITEMMKLNANQVGLDQSLEQFEGLIL